MAITDVYGQWLAAKSVGASKVFLANNQYVQGRNNADTADLNLIRVTALDELEIGILPIYNGVIDGSTSNKALVTKEYVLNVLAGTRDPKDGVRVASIGNLNLAVMPAAVDGVTLNAGDRFLAKNQTLGETNGIYIFNGAGNAATRSTDADASDEVTQGMSMVVSEGAVNAHRQYLLATPDPIVLGTTVLSFVRIPNPADLIIQQHEVLTLDLTDLDVNGYKDLAVIALHPSVELTPKGGPLQESGVDFTLSDVGLATRIDFGLSGSAGSLGEKLKEIRTVYGSTKLIVHYERLAG